MSHAHPQKEKTKKIIQELETLQESRELAEEAKAELLEHNLVLKLHADPVEEPVEETVSIEDPKTLRIAPWDKTQVKGIEKAIIG